MVDAGSVSGCHRLPSTRAPQLSSPTRVEDNPWHPRVGPAVGAKHAPPRNPKQEPKINERPARGAAAGRSWECWSGLPLSQRLLPGVLGTAAEGRVIEA